MPMRRRKGNGGTGQPSPNQLSSDLLTTTQVCETLNISKSKFYEMIKAIPLEPTLKQPKRYSRHSLTAWVQKWNNFTLTIIKNNQGDS